MQDAQKMGLMSGAGDSLGGRCGGQECPAGRLVRATPGVSPGLPGEQAEGSGSRTFSFPSCSARHMVRAQGSPERCFSEPGGGQPAGRAA